MEFKVERQEFNDITMAREFSYQVGLLLKDRLGRMSVKASSYYPTDLTIVEGTVYELEVNIKNVVDNSTIPYTITYTAQVGDGVDEVLTGLAQWVTDNASEHMITNLKLDYNNDNKKHIFFVPKDGFSLKEVSKQSLSSDGKEWTESDTPACYVGYNKNPTSSLPRIVITPLPSNTVCDRMEESVMYIDDNETEYTSSYLNFSMNVTCEAGDSDTVLRTGISASSILSDLRKRLVNEKIHYTIQNAMNSIIYPIENISPLPLLSETQYMDTARCVVDFSCVDIFIPTDLAGFMEAVWFTAGNKETEEGSIYKYTKDGQVVIAAPELKIDRREI